MSSSMLRGAESMPHSDLFLSRIPNVYSARQGLLCKEQDNANSISFTLLRLIWLDNSGHDSQIRKQQHHPAFCISDMIGETSTKILKMLKCLISYNFCHWEIRDFYILTRCRKMTLPAKLLLSSFLPAITKLLLASLKMSPETQNRLR